MEHLCIVCINLIQSSALPADTSAPSQASRGGLLLDSDIFLSLLRHQPISAAIQVEIDQSTPRLFFGVVSTWQLLMQERAGLETLPKPVLLILSGERSILGLQTLPLQEDCLQHLNRPPDLLFSPFDQLLICQALQNGFRLASEPAHLPVTGPAAAGALKRTHRSRRSCCLVGETRRLIRPTLIEALHLGHDACRTISDPIPACRCTEPSSLSRRSAAHP